MVSREFFFSCLQDMSSEKVWARLQRKHNKKDIQGLANEVGMCLGWLRMDIQNDRDDQGLVILAQVFRREFLLRLLKYPRVGGYILEELETGDALSEEGREEHLRRFEEVLEDAKRISRILDGEKD